MQVIPLSEGSFTVDGTKQFVPFDTRTDDLQDRSSGSLLVEIQPFAIVTDDDIIVLDTGLGFKNSDGILQIHQNLIDEGINPADVTKVLMSHLHKDHSGGISTTDPVLNQKFLSFPNASYYINKQELNFAFKKGRPSYHTDDFDILRNADKVILLEGSGVIDGYIHYELTGAHCPWHQVFWLFDNGKKIFFGGDVAPQLMQMKSRFIAKYDYDGKKCMELRQQWWRQAQQEGWKFLFYHDIKTPLYSF